ncbi:hypothetical protein Avbf_11582 [Armadillidium vulgare]|nr:hypothetical protein Avbf_11582 [Armadillidium vulgare]
MTKKNNQEVPFIGVIRNGTGAEFTWLTGTILETTSFMWSPGEPNNPDFEVICGSLGSTGIAEDTCDLQLLSICHIPLA